MICLKRTERGVFCTRPQTEWREIRFILLCFSVFVIVLHLLSWSYLISYFPFFFLSRKKRTIKLNFYLVLLEKSREILSATVQDSTPIQTV